MILVTGAAGFIGSNFVKHLNAHGHKDVCVSDYLTNGKQFANLKDCVYSNFVTPDRIDSALLKYVKKVFHFGAVSSTTEWNGELVLERNYNYTVELISRCVALNIPVSYSSSASVYGNGNGPLNLYAYSKFLVDQWVEGKLSVNPGLNIQGFRYFNVYGPGEWHKGQQASPYYQFTQQAQETGQIRVFADSENCKRDFVPVHTVCDIQYRMSSINKNGIFDLGTGTQKSFMEVAQEVASEQQAEIVEIPFPSHLKEHYQWSTCADMQPINSILNKNASSISKS